MENRPILPKNKFTLSIEDQVLLEAIKWAEEYSIEFTTEESIRVSQLEIVLRRFKYSECETPEYMDYAYEIGNLYCEALLEAENNSSTAKNQALSRIRLNPVLKDFSDEQILCWLKGGCLDWMPTLADVEGWEQRMKDYAKKSLELVTCSDCGSAWMKSLFEKEGNQLPDIENLASRLTPGSIVPFGECMDCGCFAYLEQGVA
jgi:hypothetical protein